MACGLNFGGRRAWVEVRLSTLAHNLRLIKNHVNSEQDASKRKVLAVVKADAYGHGAAPVAKALAKAGADWFGVTSPAEGAELRETGIREPILVLTGYWPGEEQILLDYHLTPAITRCEQLRYLERAAHAARRNGRDAIGFHLKIDTGMNRLGISPSNVECFVRSLADCSHLRLEGTFTHFASSEVFTIEQTEHQERLFSSALEQLRTLRVQPGTVHMANSAALAARRSTWADMVRPGAALYGYHLAYDPPDRGAEVEAKLPLEPVLSLRARVISLRDLAVGEGVGYNARFVSRRPTRIAVIAAGYADGLLRGLSNGGRVILRGHFAPLVGAISMDLAMADVTDLKEVHVGDVATIFGTDGPATQSASDVAQILGTVVQDVLCAVGKSMRVPRFYIP